MSRKHSSAVVRQIRGAGRGRTVTAAVCASLLGALALASQAHAQLGKLTFERCLTGNSETAPCTALAGATSGGSGSGLDSIGPTALSPDGRSLYAVSGEDDAVVHFRRNPVTGRLTFAGCRSGDTAPIACTQIDGASAGGADSGLDDATGVAISPNGASLYVSSDADDSIAWFVRDLNTGSLYYDDCISAETQSGPAGSTACHAIGGATSFGVNTGFNGLSQLAISADGTDLYATAGGDHAVARFSRMPDGTLDDEDCFTGDSDVVACTVITNASSTGEGSGLNAPFDLVLSPDGSSLYASTADTAVARFSRAGDGTFAYQDCLTGDDDVGGAGACTSTTTATSGGDDSGLAGLTSLAISPDGSDLYATAVSDTAVVHFSRAANGTLAFEDCDTGEVAAGPTGSGACSPLPYANSFGQNSGLAYPIPIVVSPDGASLYAGAVQDAAVGYFARNKTTGALSWRGCVSGRATSGPAGSGACELTPGATGDGLGSGLYAIFGLALSANGRSLYATAGFDDSVVQFQNPTCKGRPATQVGTPGPDEITGTSIRDVVVALAGADRIDTKAGNDLVCAGKGNDLVDTRNGADRVDGEAGNDRILGGAARDFLFGQAGFDRIFGNAGPDRLFGGALRDRIFGGAGNDRGLGGAGNDLLVGGAGRDGLFGGAGRDALRGLAGRRDFCHGGPARDRRRAPGCEIRRSIP